MGTLMALRADAAGPSEEALSRLLPEEVRFARALPTRRREEWLAGRLCLEAALADVGASRVPLLPTVWGAPAVPSGSTASVSHKGDLAVALARASETRVGVDLEEHRPADWRLATRIQTPSETKRIARLHFQLRPLATTVLFAAKEAAFKALTPHDQERVDFDDLEIGLELEHVGNPAGRWLQALCDVDGCSSPLSMAVLVDKRWIIAAASAVMG